MLVLVTESTQIHQLVYSRRRCTKGREGHCCSCVNVRLHHIWIDDFYVMHQHDTNYMDSLQRLSWNHILGGNDNGVCSFNDLAVKSYSSTEENVGPMCFSCCRKYGECSNKIKRIIPKKQN